MVFKRRSILSYQGAGSEPKDPKAEGAQFTLVMALSGVHNNRLPQFFSVQVYINFPVAKRPLTAVTCRDLTLDFKSIPKFSLPSLG